MLKVIFNSLIICLGYLLHRFEEDVIFEYIVYLESFGKLEAYLQLCLSILNLFLHYITGNLIRRVIEIENI